MKYIIRVASLAFFLLAGCHDGSEGSAPGGGGSGGDALGGGGAPAAGGSGGVGGGGGSVGGSACRPYCGVGMSSQDLAGRCAAAHFSGTFPTQCPAGEAPAGCDSLSDYSPGVTSTCPGETAPEDIWCCAM